MAGTGAEMGHREKGQEGECKQREKKKKRRKRGDLKKSNNLDHMAIQLTRNV